MPYQDVYLCIDLEKTGRNLQELMRRRGYTVRDVQNILHLSCPQPVYRWIRGQILPSVDHLLVLSRVLQVHMEELLVTAYRLPGGDSWGTCMRRKRMSEYGRRLLWRKAA